MAVQDLTLKLATPLSVTNRLDACFEADSHSFKHGSGKPIISCHNVLQNRLACHEADPAR